MDTLNDLQIRLASLIDRKPSAPAQGADDWNLRTNYFNIAQNEYVNAYPWKGLRYEYNSFTSTATGNNTISMPTDYRRIAGFVRAEGRQYPQIKPDERELYSVNDEYFYETGNPYSGYSLVINPSPLSSGASICVPYYSKGQSLASPADISVCPQPDFLVWRAAQLVWEGRDDARYIEAKTNADEIIVNMLEYEQVLGISYDDRIKTREELKGFRIGRD